MKALVTAEIDSVLLSDKFADLIHFDYKGYHLDHTVLPHAELLSMIPDYDILICEYDTITSDILDAAEKLKLIICCRGGVSSVIDLDRAMQKKIIVCNTPGRNAGSVTDMVIGYILAMTRNIFITNELIHSGELTSDYSTKPKEYKDTVWGLDEDSPFIRFRGKSINNMTLGIIGYGNAGRLLAEKARVFGLNILAYDPYSDFHDKPDYVKSVSWDEIITTSDIISVHCILSSQTKNLFSKIEFNKMKKGAYFINTSRGEIVVEEDMVEALNNGKLAGAAIDVTRTEPIASDSILLKANNLIITPHIAGSSDDVQYVGTQMVIKNLNDFVNNCKPENAVVYC